MLLSLIAAMDRRGVIGNENELPWRLPADMQWFRRHTLGKPVLMGRRTWESLDGALPKRTNLVLSRSAGFTATGATVVGSLEEAMAAAGDVAEMVCIGGAKVFAAMLPRAGRLYLTHIDHDFGGDAYFPAFDEAEWRLVHEEHHAPDARNAWPYGFRILERIAPGDRA